MNAFTKVLAHERVLTEGQIAAKHETLILPLPKLSFSVLVIAVLLSALSVIYVKDYNRRLFVDYQKLQQENVMLQANSGKLVFEQGLVAPRPYVQEVAEKKLDMKMPLAQDVVLVDE